VAAVRKTSVILGFRERFATSPRSFEPLNDQSGQMVRAIGEKYTGVTTLELNRWPTARIAQNISRKALRQLFVEGLALPQIEMTRHQLNFLPVSVLKLRLLAWDY
jgi:hypothetical protein